MEWITALVDSVLGSIVGGGATQAVTMATLFLITILAILLLAARVELELALVIISPAIIVASFSGFLPPLAFGLVVFLIGLFFTGVILALAR